MEELALANQHQQQQMQLVYTVKPLPEPFFYFLWNYDVLDEDDELSYIKQIIIAQNKKTKVWTNEEYINKTIA